VSGWQKNAAKEIGDNKSAQWLIDNSPALQCWGTSTERTEPVKRATESSRVRSDAMISVVRFADLKE
jgi:hypothetical protein